MRKCKRCNKEYNPSSNPNKYCSECKKLSTGILSGRLFDFEKVQICKNCRQEFFYHRKRIYCSDKCMKEYQLSKAKTERQQPDFEYNRIKYRNNCTVCNAEFETKRKQAKYCPCCVKSLNGQRLIDMKKLVEKRNCFRCGVEFDALKMWNNIYCSKACQDAVNSKKYRSKIKKAFIENISEIEICERDKWVCQLCNSPVDKFLNYPHPLSKSFDHIIPLSKNGTHEARNIQLTHLFCNLSKGNKYSERWCLDANSNETNISNQGRRQQAPSV